MKCDFCHSNSLVEKQILFKSQPFRLIKCGDCGFAFIKVEKHGVMYDRRYYEGGVYIDGYNNEIPELYSLAKQVVDLKGILPNNRKRDLKPIILDVGCAYGYLLKSLEEEFITHGVDISKFAIDQAKKLSRKTVFKVCDAECGLPYSNNTFDFITLIDTLEHFESPFSVLSECRRVLKSGGVLYVETYNSQGLLSRLTGREWREFYPPYHLSFLDLKKLTRFIEKEFEIYNVSAEGFCYYPNRIKDILAKISKPIIDCLNIGDHIVLIAVKKV